MQPVPEETLRAVERHLHAVIRGRAARFIDQYAVPLPSLAAMLAGEATAGFGPVPGSAGVWLFRVRGMYGGFRVRWIDGGPAAKLEAVSFCRIADHSGQRHEIKAGGSTLVEAGMF